MTKLNYLIVMLFLGSSIALNSLYAQQDVFYTQFWNVQNYYNPANAGLHYKHETTVLGSSQLRHWNYAPNDLLFGSSVKVDKLHGGIGINYLLHDDFVLTSNKIKLNYNYQFAFKNEHVLSLGGAVGVNMINYKRIFMEIMPSIDDETGAGFTADLGVVYKMRKMNLGVSFTQIPEQRIAEFSKEKTKMIVQADYIFGKDSGLQFKPQAFFMTDFNFSSLHLNGLVMYKNTFIAGIGYVHDDSFSAVLGWNIKTKYCLTYSYDLTVSKLNNGVSGGSHELSFGFRLK